MVADLFAMQSFEHGRCPICWAVVRKEDEAKHMEWHDKLVSAVAQALREAEIRRGERR